MRIFATRFVALFPVSVAPADLTCSCKYAKLSHAAVGLPRAASHSPGRKRDYMFGLRAPVAPVALGAAGSLRSRQCPLPPVFAESRRSAKRARAAVIAALVSLTFACGSLHASIIDSGDLLTVNSSRILNTYTYGGVPQQTLPIDFNPVGGAFQGSPQGVAVIGSRLFIGMVSPNASFTPKILEINPNNGAVISVMNTATANLTGMGDDGTNLLLLNSQINAPGDAWQVYTYSTAGALLGQTGVSRNSPNNFQGEGIDSDGSSIFLSDTNAPQNVITDSMAGAFQSTFNTNMFPLVSYIGALAHDPNDDTLWVAGNSEFRHFTRTGTLLSAPNTGLGNSSWTGLEVIAVPEPSAFALIMFGLLSARSTARRRRLSVGGK